MIRVAAGEPLAFGQADLAIKGWSIESRLYAEDPYRGFLPSIGRLGRSQSPAQGAPRSAAIETMAGALEDLHIEGLGHNAPFLSAVMDQPRFQEGRLSTGYIA